MCQGHFVLTTSMAASIQNKNFKNVRTFQLRVSTKFSQYKYRFIGKVDRKKPRGRSLTRWADEIKSLTGLPPMRTSQDQGTYGGVLSRK